MDVTGSAGGDQRLRITETHDAGSYVLTVEGEIDLSTAPQFRTALETVLRAEPAGIVFDLGGVEFIDSSGLAVLIEAATATRVQLVRPSHAVRRVIELTGLAKILPVTP